MQQKCTKAHFSICFDAFHLKSDMMLMKIFFSRRHSPTNMTLRFVNIQNHSCLYSKNRTDLSEAFGDVFMYRRLTNTILFRRLTHRCIVVYDISCNFHCPFLDITFHSNPRIVCFFTIYAGSF